MPWLVTVRCSGLARCIACDVSLPAWDAGRGLQRQQDAAWQRESHVPFLQGCGGRTLIALSTKVQTPAQLEHRGPGFSLEIRVQDLGLYALSAGPSGRARPSLSWTLMAPTAPASLSHLTQPWESCQKLWTWQASRCVLRCRLLVDLTID